MKICLLPGISKRSLPFTVDPKMLLVAAELKCVEIRTEIDGEPEFIGDFHYTSEAIVNLLKNAAEHTPGAARLRQRSATLQRISSSPIRERALPKGN